MVGDGEVKDMKTWRIRVSINIGDENGCVDISEDRALADFEVTRHVGGKFNLLRSLMTTMVEKVLTHVPS